MLPACRKSLVGTGSGPFCCSSRNIPSLLLLGRRSSLCLFVQRASAVFSAISLLRAFGRAIARARPSTQSALRPMNRSVKSPPAHSRKVTLAAASSLTERHSSSTEGKVLTIKLCHLTPVAAKWLDGYCFRVRQLRSSYVHSPQLVRKSGSLFSKSSRQ